MLEIKDISKKYKTGDLVQTALDHVSLNLRDNEFVAILGPSGSGKTTLLNIIGGLDRYDSGDLVINRVSTKQYKDKDWDSYRNHTIGFVFQSYNLIPHQSILANVELALTISGVNKSERKKRALKALEEVGLKEQAHKKPNQLSGGQMQRVAIARALVNNPEILLADEPTGALDTATSLQVMDLLKEVAKDRLVVMVTHNPELAYEYANRIVEIKDGKIINDSNPYVIKEEETTHQNFGKSSMSFLTALSLSFNNLRTKKGRTFLTAFAGSIGIIGIALILSLSTGVNTYINSIEEETLSEYPLMIENTGFDFSSMISGAIDDISKEAKEDEILVSNMLTNMFSSVGSNDLAALLKELKSTDELDDYVKAIEYDYNMPLEIYKESADDIYKVNPDTTFSSVGLGGSQTSNSAMSSMMSTDIFFELPENKSLYEDSYEVLKGHWPTNENEAVLVLTSSGYVSDFMLYGLGLRDHEDLKAMVEAFASSKDVVVPDTDDSYTYDDIIGIEYKVVSQSSYYEYDDKYEVWVDKSEDQNYLKGILEEAIDLKIVGIVKVKDDASAAMLKSGIGYTKDLSYHIYEINNNSQITKDQLADPTINVFTSKSFNESSSSLEFKDLISIDQNKIRAAFKFDQSKLNIDLSSVDLSDISIDFDTLPDFNTDDLLKDIDFDFSTVDASSLSTQIANDFSNWCLSNGLSDPNETANYFKAYLNSKEGQDFIKAAVTSFLNESGISEKVIAKLKFNVEGLINDYSKAIMKQVLSKLSSKLNDQMMNVAKNFQNAISFDEAMFASAISFNMDEEEFSTLLVSMMTSQKDSYENNLQDLGYVDLETPSSIDIYPLNFEAKSKVVEFLDDYNQKMEKEDETKVISYVDYVGTLMSSVTDIINVISYVLIAFVAISLIVSSIMIGVITYISVLERNKEIGILRSIGASKGNISAVFNAETIIIGFFAGAIGIIVSLVLLIPINAIIHSIAGTDEVSAILPINGAIILVILSVILTLIGGLIPSRKAANSDPVTALRSE